MSEPALTTMNHVLGTRGVTSVSVTALGIRLVATPSMFAAGSRHALIVSDANPCGGYGYVRMFQTLRSQSGADIKIYSIARTRTAGSAWSSPHRPDV